MTINSNINIRQTTLAVAGEIGKAMKQVALLVQREAKKNAPRSPTVKQINSTLVRKKRTKRRAFPGGLEKSIDFDGLFTGASAYANIFVASNSPAGKYAKRIHDEKGIKWRKRGIGTMQKGERADDKFIERAVRDSNEIIVQKLSKAFEKGLRK